MSDTGVGQELPRPSSPAPEPVTAGASRPVADRADRESTGGVAPPGRDEPKSYEAAPGQVEAAGSLPPRPERLSGDSATSDGTGEARAMSPSARRRRRRKSALERAAEPGGPYAAETPRPKVGETRPAETQPPVAQPPVAEVPVAEPGSAYLAEAPRPKIGDTRPARPQPAPPHQSAAQPGVAQPPVAEPGSAYLAEAPRPKIGDTRPARPQPAPAQQVPARPGAAQPGVAQPGGAAPGERAGSSQGSGPGRSRSRRRGSRGRGERSGADAGAITKIDETGTGAAGDGRTGRAGRTVAVGARQAAGAGDGVATEPSSRAAGTGRSRRRGGAERGGRPLGRYLMCVHVRPHATQIAVLEGRTLVEHSVAWASDASTQIDGNIYRGRVQNVLPGMEAAFVDIGTPKNAVLYRGDVRYDLDDIETPSGSSPRIEEVLRPGQSIVCQVTKNPIGAKGARLTQEVSLPGRFVVMVPGSSAFGISKRLDDAERRRLRRIVQEVRPKGHGLIVRTAAEGASLEELRHDVDRLVEQWNAIEAEAKRSQAAALLYKEPDMAVRLVREELNRDYRGVVVDDPELYAEVRDYVEGVNPELAERVEFYDTEAEGLPIFERFHVHEQLHKALDRKVWLPSGGSLVIERTEALTVIDVNTGKNVGKSNLEETVFRNNLEAAEEVARQLRLRDIGGIIVIDFIDMEIRDNREKVVAALRSALARDKTRTQVFDISELGLVEMTRKRVSEGLVESLSSTCAVCGGRGIVLDESLL